LAQKQSGKKIKRKKKDSVGDDQSDMYTASQSGAFGLQSSANGLKKRNSTSDQKGEDTK